MSAYCVICTDIYDEYDMTVSLSCGHVYHSNCIFPWMDISETCPECRHPICLSTIRKVYFSFATPSEIEAKIKYHHLELQSSNSEIQSLKTAKNDAEDALKKLQDNMSKHEKYISDLEDAIETKINEENIKFEALERQLYDLPRVSKNYSPLIKLTKKIVKTFYKYYNSHGYTCRRLAFFSNFMAYRVKREILCRQEIKRIVDSMKIDSMKIRRKRKVLSIVARQNINLIDTDGCPSLS